MSFEIKKKTETIETKIYTCDACGKKISPDVYSCVICGDHLCYDCVLFDPREMGDYPDKYCKSCWDVGDYYRKEIDRLREIFYEQEEGLEKACKQQAIREKEKKNEKSSR